MRDTGRMTSLTDKDVSITHSPSFSRENSTIKIFPSWEIIGFTMRACSKTTQSMARVT